MRAAALDITDFVYNFWWLQLKGLLLARKADDHAGSINKSLLSRKIINGLADGGVAHVQYRDSVLTWTLKDGLGAEASCVMLATIVVPPPPTRRRPHRRCGMPTRPSSIMVHQRQPDSNATIGDEAGEIDELARAGSRRRVADGGGGGGDAEVRYASSSRSRRG